MTQFLSLLTAFGLGSIITALVQAFLARSSQKDERAFREKQAAYIGLLEAFHKAAVEGSPEAGNAFVYWQMRCDLVATTSVRGAIRLIVETNDDRPAREVAIEAMKAAMRADLGISD
ncbi:hypothetical protein [Novosphingobium sp. FKTRR1]|uniref:hypothetical protein n=1 Tax=Novosphingobium sp. FKTRR1 TaxID=2879118 RepID=UPI001CF06082|nr:hypothetical protein [Novosphingobium sp. FKTRR1]